MASRDSGKHGGPETTWEAPGKTLMVQSLPVSCASAGLLSVASSAARAAAAVCSGASPYI